MKRLFNFIFILFTLLALLSCDSNDLQSASTLNLSVEDVSCTEAWLQLTTNNIQLPVTINLLKNNSISQIFILNTQDSLLYIDSLLPNQIYKFKIVANTTNNPQPTTNEVLAQTMDTTSHNFTWQILTWGNSGSSTLFDVAIINENDIWAVGEIKIADSSLAGYTQYNVVHWNGTDWEFKRIMFYYNCGQPDTYSFGIRSIFVINPNEIWVAMDGDQIAKIENGVQTKTVCVPYSFSIKKMWGTSNSDLYAVGYSGNIIHYNGTSWNRIESGTTLNINDIWGAYNSKTKEWEILAVASNEYSSFDRELIKINKTSSTLLSKSGIEEPLHGIWFKPNKKYYAVGSGTYEKTHLNDPEWKGDPLDLTEYFENNVRAKDVNDVVSVGAFGEILHFNGYSWKSYISETYLQNGTLLSVDIKNNLVVATGWISQQAVLIIGKR